MAHLKLHDVYGDASVLVVVDGQEASFGSISAPFSEVVHGDLAFASPAWPGGPVTLWAVWEWNGSAPVACADASARNIAKNGLVIHRALPFWAPGDDRDWTKMGFAVDEVSVSGELQTRTWYTKATVPSLGQPDFSVGKPVVKHTYTYDRDEGYPKTRDALVEVYREDGTIDPGCTHTLVEPYQAAEMIDEGKRRRRRLINNMSATLVAMIQVTGPATLAVATTEAKGFAKRHSDAISEFKRYNDQTLATSITNDTGNGDDWLDNLVDVAPFSLPAGTKIRDYLVAEIQGAQ